MKEKTISRIARAAIKNSSKFTKEATYLANKHVTYREGLMVTKEVIDNEALYIARALTMGAKMVKGKYIITGICIGMIGNTIMNNILEDRKKKKVEIEEA